MLSRYQADLSRLLFRTTCFCSIALLVLHASSEGHTEIDMSVIIIDRCWREDSILRKIRESRWTRTLNTVWPSGINYGTDGLQSVRFARPSSQTMPHLPFITEQINNYQFTMMYAPIIVLEY